MIRCDYPGCGWALSEARGYGRSVCWYQDEQTIACPRHMLDEDAKDAARRAVAERIAKEGKE